MDLVIKFFDGINWESVLATLLHILVILIIFWIILFFVKKALQKLVEPIGHFKDQCPVFRMHTSGEIVIGIHQKNI